MPVAQELVEVVRELLVATAPVQRKAPPQPAERRRGILFQQTFEAHGHVDHRRLRKCGKRLVRGLDGEVRAVRLAHGVVAHHVVLAAAEGVERMEVEMRRPRLVRIEEDARLLARARDLPHGIEDALVCAGGENEKPRLFAAASGRTERRAHVLERHRPPHAQGRVPTRGQIPRHRARGHHRVVDALVAVAVHEHDFAGAQQRHQHRLVRRGRAVRDVAALRRAEDFARHALRFGKRRARLGTGEITQRLHGHGKVRAEDGIPERVVEAA